MPVVSRRSRAMPLFISAAVGLAACSTGSTTPDSAIDTARSSAGGLGTSSVVPTSTASARTVSSSTATTTSPTSPSATPPATPPATAVSSCEARLVGGLSAEEKAGQLLMVGLDVNAGRTSLDTLVQQHYLGGVILLGGWFDGVASTKEVTDHLRSLAGASTGGLGLLIAGDAEGGQVQQPRGVGFTRLPTALTQGRMSSGERVTLWQTVGRELLSSGVNVDLAPVTDTVPAEIGRRNQPIGRWERQYSSDPSVVATAASDVIAGLHRSGVMTSIKHFPGLGRITGNTDFADGDITDETATVNDPYLGPFQAGIAAGSDMVMVSSAWYPKLDAENQAMFSPAIVTDLLRGRLGWGGVTITDDVGAAKAVAAVPISERALRFVSAGGDIVLTARPTDVPIMTTAVVKRMQADAAFAALVDRSVTRVVAMKSRYGLTACSR